MLAEFREEWFTETRHFIKHKLGEKYEPNGTGFAVIKNQAQLLRVLKVVHYFGQVGLLVDSGLLPPRLISQCMGKAVSDCWMKLKTYINEEQKRTDGSREYAENFKLLVNLCNEDTQSAAHAAT